MRLSILALAFFLTAPFLTKGQNQDLLDKSFKNYERKERSQYSKFRKSFSLDFKFGILTEVAFSPTRIFQARDRETNEIVSFTKRVAVTPSLLNLSIDPRLSFFQNDKYTVGLKLSSVLGQSFVEDHPAQSSKGFSGLHFSQSFLLFYGLGYRGPYNNIAPFGVTFSAGINATIAPFINTQSEEIYFKLDYELLPGNESYFSRVFILPSFQVDFYRNDSMSIFKNMFSLAGGFYKDGYFARFLIGFPLF